MIYWLNGFGLLKMGKNPLPIFITSKIGIAYLDKDWINCNLYQFIIIMLELILLISINMHRQFE